MKKLILITAVLTLVLSIGAVGVFATEAGNFVDENNDGICDNRANCQGQNFVDEDNDGVCDRREGCQGQHRGNGNGCGRHHN